MMKKTKTADRVMRPYSVPGTVIAPFTPVVVVVVAVRDSGVESV